MSARGGAPPSLMRQVVDFNSSGMRFRTRFRPGRQQTVIERTDTLDRARSEAVMDYFKRFNFLFAAPAFDADDLEGVRFNQIVAEIERSGFEVVRARRIEDAEVAVKTDA